MNFSACMEEPAIAKMHVTVSRGRIKIWTNTLQRYEKRSFEGNVRPPGIIYKKYARCINLVRGAGQLTHGVMEYLSLTWRDTLSHGIWHIHRTLRALAHEWLGWSWTENLHYTHTCSHSSHCIELFKWAWALTLNTTLTTSWCFVFSSWALCVFVLRNTFLQASASLLPFQSLCVSALTGDIERLDSSWSTMQARPQDIKLSVSPPSIWLVQRPVDSGRRDRYGTRPFTEHMDYEILLGFLGPHQKPI